ncbi:LbtU family siderophore porin [Gammaproteobacteria bacterium]|nr:LbtU family siderophore porin [Gammaproteobacteria bacterium]
MKKRIIAIFFLSVNFISLPALAENTQHHGASSSANNHVFSSLNNLRKIPKITNKSSLTDDGTIAAGNSQIEGTTDLPTKGPLYLPVDLNVPGQSFVSSGPYIGIPLEFTGGHLIVNSPSINEDVILLNVNKNITQRLSALGRPIGKALGSHILLSGSIEGQALNKNIVGMKSTSDIDLSTVNLDAFIMGPSQWTSAFFEFSYDNNIGSQTGSFSSNNRMLNSRVRVSRAFIILGDFMRSPFYASFGQMNVPFGVYSTTMSSSPLTKILGKTLSRAIVVGYKSPGKNSLLVSGYAFNGPSHVNASSAINNGGLNINYSFVQDRYTAKIGGGVIANIADSIGMQFTGNNQNNPPMFGGFGGPNETYVIDGVSSNPSFPVVSVATGNENISHMVPAVDINAKLGLGAHLQMIVEYLFATTSFSHKDLKFNDSGAQPQALNMEIAYNLPWFENPTSIGASYQMSRDALAIGLPASRYSTTANTSFWKNTLQTVEFRRDVNYGVSDTSSGSMIQGPSGNSKSANVVTLKFDYFF